VELVVGDLHGNARVKEHTSTMREVESLSSWGNQWGNDAPLSQQGCDNFGSPYLSAVVGVQFKFTMEKNFAM
jgi:hypothetical protein